jgi:DNA (cytosine-5)-methyltransferase 1
MSQPTYVELFAGAGGLSLGLDRAGWRCVGHAEIEPHARAVLRYRWPDTPLYGDVATLDGTQWRGVTMISGGSPCQDLSIAGKREGLTGRRSGLFHHQVRLWVESQAPLFLWENVVGALSSNQGKDFARIISSILGEPVAVPRDGKRRRAKWATAGYVAGTRGVTLAWRVLDLRGFGVPQRRRRVFIVAARSGAPCPAKILLLGDSLHRDASPEPTQSQAAAASDARVYDGRGNGDGLTCNTLSGDHMGRPGDYSTVVLQFVGGAARPRRLLPVESERLQSWPDGWAAVGINEQGREYTLRDTPRYKCCGNGVASIVAEWIGRRIAAQLTTTETPK